MANFFDYSRLRDTVNFDGGFPGQKSRITPLDYIIPCVAGEDIEFGSAVKVTRDAKGYKCVLAKASADFGGIALADVKGQFVRNDGYINTVPKGQNISVMRKGHVWVPVQTGKASVASGGKVYIRKTASSGGLPVGGLEASADSTNNEALSNTVFGGIVGNPVSGTNAATTSSVKTSYVAEVVVDLGLI